MGLSVRLRRSAYRAAYVGLRVYWFLLRPAHQGVKCVLSDGDRVLLVRHTYGPAEWELPGGSVRRGEAPVLTATREIGEELGLHVHRWTALGQVRGRRDHCHELLHCYATELRDPPLTLDPVEIAAAGWFPRTELPQPLGAYSAFILGRAAAPTRSSTSS